MGNFYIYSHMFSPYLKTQRSLSPAQKDQKQELALIKLGDELHGPEDEIKINRDNILYIETLKEDGKVVQAIKTRRKRNK